MPAYLSPSIAPPAVLAFFLCSCPELPQPPLLTLCRVTPREINATKLAGMSIPVTWVVSSKPSFATVQATGKATATADSDFTVKVGTLLVCGRLDEVVG